MKNHLDIVSALRAKEQTATGCGSIGPARERFVTTRQSRRAPKCAAGRAGSTLALDAIRCPFSIVLFRVFFLFRLFRSGQRQKIFIFYFSF